MPHQEWGCDSPEMYILTVNIHILTGNAHRLHRVSKPHDSSSNNTGGYSEDLRWLVILKYMWLFEGYSKIRTAQELSVKTHLCEEGQTPQLTEGGNGSTEGLFKEDRGTNTSYT